MLSAIESILAKIFLRKRKWTFQEFLKNEIERLRIGKIKLTQMKNIFKIIGNEYKYKMFVIFNDMKRMQVSILV